MLSSLFSFYSLEPVQHHLMLLKPKVLPPVDVLLGLNLVPSVLGLHERLDIKAVLVMEDVAPYGVDNPNFLDF